jgi:hypothetical protein
MAVSERMKVVLIAYCEGMDANGLRSLSNDVKRGGLAWFPDEFAEAIKSEDFTPRKWEQFTNVLMDDDDDALLDEYLRQVWSRAAPERPYPLDA